MTELAAALYDFWSGFGIPAYLQDNVPDDAVLPYITYELVRGDAMSATVLVAHNWHQKAAGGNAARHEVMDAIARAIPSQGRVVSVGSGSIALYRNDANFQTDVADEEDPSVIGGRTSYEVHFYMT